MKKSLFVPIILLISLHLFASISTSENKFFISFEKKQEYYIAFVSAGNNNSIITQGDIQYFTSSSNQNPSLELGIKYCLPNSSVLRLMFSAQTQGSTGATGSGFMLIRDEDDSIADINGLNYKVEYFDESNSLIETISPENGFVTKSWPIANRVMEIYNNWDGNNSGSQSSADVEHTGKIVCTILPFAETTSDGNASSDTALTFANGVFYGYAYLILQMNE